MKIILAQQVKFADGGFYNWTQNYDCDITPIVGAEVWDPIWKNPDEYKITGFSINFSENTYSVGLEPFNGVYQNEKREDLARMAKSHGWKPSWE